MRKVTHSLKSLAKMQIYHNLSCILDQKSMFFNYIKVAKNKIVFLSDNNTDLYRHKQQIH